MIHTAGIRPESHTACHAASTPCYMWQALQFLTAWPHPTRLQAVYCNVNASSCCHDAVMMIS